MAPAKVTTASGASWQEVAADRQAHRDATISLITPPLPELTNIPRNTIPLAKQVLTSEEIQITESTVEDLATAIAKKQFTAVTVTKAFLRRAALAQIACNCITELLPERSLARAEYLDKYLAEHGKTIGPLHGVPISVKEHIGVKDLDHNAGFVAWVGRTSPEDAHIVQILEAAGGVFHVRTTQPQTLMHLETSSNLYGTTTNPFNTTLTAGGSSGGEGALVGFRGSCLGIGTDIGGSIRSPAANNGLYGMKPTTWRLPVGGWTATMAGSESIVPTIGPLSTSLLGCRIFIKAIIDAKPWYKEPFLLPIPWKEEPQFSSDKKIKIAVLWDDGVVKPHPPITRALENVVSKLRENNRFEIVDWKPYKHDLAWEIIANLYFADNASQELSAIDSSQEPLLPMSKHILLPPTSGGGNPHVQDHTIHSLWSACAKRDQYKAEYAAHWNATATPPTLSDQVDIILSPVGPSAAPKLETAKWWGYTSQWNLLDYPALVFPVDKVSVERDGEKVEYEPRNEKDKYNWGLWEEFGAEGWKDAPISLQFIGRRYEDEKVIQALEIVQKEIGLPFVKYT